jgi:hypothetical protein
VELEELAAREAERYTKSQKESQGNIFSTKKKKCSVNVLGTDLIE